MKKIYSVTVLVFMTVSLGIAQIPTSIKEISGMQSSPTLIPTNQTYTTCGYLQEDNNLENGRASDSGFPLICADDFIVPAGACWNVQNFSVPYFVPAGGPGAALSIDLYLFSDNVGTPGTVLNTYNAVPAEWNTVYKGNNFGLDMYTFNITIATPMNICGGATGTTYWFGTQVQTSGGTFYWEFTTTQPYGSNGVNASSAAGPWSNAGDNFVFELGTDASSTDIQTACNSYTWIDGNTYTSSNNTATYTYVGGAANGCDSIVTLDLTITNSTTGTDVQSACDSYTWIDGNTYTSTNNTATHTLINAAGCDSIVTLDLTITNSSAGTDVQTACDSYTWIDGNTYTTSNNTATFTLTNAAGCDSVVTLDLIITNSTTGTDVQTACGSYTWIDGNTYTTSNNTATHILTNAAGCDSIVTLDLTISNANTGTDLQTACDSYTWIDGNTYTTSNNTATFTLTNAAGCDSVVTLDLTITNSTTGTDVQTACDSYTWIDGNTYTSSNNTAAHTLTNAAGCDSVVTLDLTITNSTTGTDVQTACGSYTWIDGNTYTSSNNTATHTLTNASGCDSIVTLDLTINTVDLGIVNNSPTLVASADPATFQWVNCDENYNLITGETGNEYTAMSNGNYAVIVTQNGCTDTTDCQVINNIGIEENNSIDLNLYPNPTNGEVYLITSNSILQISVHTIDGQLIYNDVNLNSNTLTINLTNNPKGVYLVTVQTNIGSATKRIIKQ